MLFRVGKDFTILSRSKHVYVWMDSLEHACDLWRKRIPSFSQQHSRFSRLRVSTGCLPGCVLCVSTVNMAFSLKKPSVIYLGDIPGEYDRENIYNMRTRSF